MEKIKDAETKNKAKVNSHEVLTKSTESEEIAKSTQELPRDSAKPTISGVNMSSVKTEKHIAKEEQKGINKTSEIASSQLIK